MQFIGLSCFREDGEGSFDVYCWELSQEYFIDRSTAIYTDN